MSQIYTITIRRSLSFWIQNLMIQEFMNVLFPGYKIDASGTYRVMRDMDLDVAEEDTSDLLRSVQHQLRAREHGQVMRLEIGLNFDEWLEKQCKSAINNHGRLFALLARFVS